MIGEAVGNEVQLTCISHADFPLFLPGDESAARWTGVFASKRIFGRWIGEQVVRGWVEGDAAHRTEKFASPVFGFVM